MKDFENKYLRYTEYLSKFSAGKAPYAEFHKYKISVIDEYVDLIKVNGWNYESFLDNEFKRVLDSNNKLNENFISQLNQEFKKEYLEGNDYVYFLFLVIYEKTPGDITDTLNYVAKVFMNPESDWHFSGDIIESFSFFSNPKCLPVIDYYLENVAEDYLIKDILYNISHILVVTHTKEAIEIIKKNLNNPMELIREEMLGTYNYMIEKGLI